MPRKRTNRRREVSKKQFRLSMPTLPSIDWGPVFNGVLILGAVGCVYVGTMWLMDQPINAVRIDGHFERVTPVQIEAAMSPYLDRGFLSVSLSRVQESIEALPWVERASIRRSWPATLSVTVTEERAAARWGEQGLLNVYGELFVEDASHIPAELPHLNGPKGTELQVSQHFFELDRQLQQRGLTAASLSFDQRGSWLLGVSNGMQIRFGTVDIARRTVRFFAALDQVPASTADRIDYIDMRYTNGFAIGWKPVDKTRLAGTGESRPNA